MENGLENKLLKTYINSTPITYWFYFVDYNWIQKKYMYRHMFTYITKEMHYV